MIYVWFENTSFEANLVDTGVSSEQDKETIQQLLGDSCCHLGRMQESTNPPVHTIVDKETVLFHLIVVICLV